MSFRVYKADIRHFIEAVRVKAIHSVSKQYDDKINALKEERSRSFMVIRDHAVKILGDMINGLDQASQDSGLEWGAHGAYKSAINYMEHAMRNLNSISMLSLNNDETEQALRSECEQRIEEVRAEYNKLSAFCDVHTAKETYNMLKDLGFDVSSLERTKNMPTVQADKSKLFVCGDNK